MTISSACLKFEEVENVIDRLVMDQNEMLKPQIDFWQNKLNRMLTNASDTVIIYPEEMDYLRKLEKQIEQATIIFVRPDPRRITIISSAFRYH